MKSKRKVRLTLDIDPEDWKEFDRVRKTGNKRRSKAAMLRQGLRLLLAVENGKIFLSTSSDCPNQVPTSIL